MWAFQNKDFTESSGEHIIYKEWKRLQGQPFANLKVYTCIRKMPNCSQYDAISIQRPKFIEKALQTKQPANSEQYHCVGLIISFDLLHSAWITLPCDMKFSATFICENIPNNTKINNQNVSAPNVRTSFQLVKKGDRIVLNQPHVRCKFPWSQQVRFVSLYSQQIVLKKCRHSGLLTSVIFLMHLYLCSQKCFLALAM